MTIRSTLFAPIGPADPMRQFAVSRPGDKVALNPQPLPPRDVFGYVKQALQGGMVNSLASRGIIIVGGRGR